MDSTLYLKTLGALALFFDKAPFRPLHSTVRIGLVYFFVPIWARAIGCSIRIRHSATRSSDYNFLYSDLDLDLLVADDEIDEVPLKIQRINRSRQWFPFIGEIEVYRPEERRYLESHREKTDGWYTVIRSWRKIAWLYSESPRSPYHRRKRDRALMKCLSEAAKAKLGFSTPGQSNAVPFDDIGQERVLKASILDHADALKALVGMDHSPNHGSESELRIESEYLSFPFEVSDRESGADGAPLLCLNRDIARAVLSIIPYEPPSHLESQLRLNGLRSNSRVQSIFQSMIEAEILITQAYNRATGGSNGWMVDWNRKLKNLRLQSRTPN